MSKAKTAYDSILYCRLAGVQPREAAPRRSTKISAMARRRAIAVAPPTPFPAQFILRILRGILIVALVLAIVLVAAGGVLTYQIITVRNDAENITPASYLLSSYEIVNFQDRQGIEHEGWLLLGLKGAPVVVLCHGYNSNRSELLPLGTALRENHFNVYLFNFQTPKARTSSSSLGVDQSSQVLSAIEAILKQPDINPGRVGLFGTTTGGYAAILAAQQSSQVKALVADAIYDDPDQMFDVQVDRVLGGAGSLFRLVAEKEFHLFSRESKAPQIHDGLGKLDKVHKLFISGRNEPMLAAETEYLYNLAPPPKRLLVLERAQADLAAEAEKKEYENQVLSFFLQNLPLRAD